MPKAGFDAVKFQTYITEDLVHESNKLYLIIKNLQILKTSLKC